MGTGAGSNGWEVIMVPGAMIWARARMAGVQTVIVGAAGH